MSSTKPSAGSVFIVAAPSGAGKSSLVNALLAQEPGIVLSVSFTTRAPRPGEQDGREYFFVSEAEFREREAKAEFLESAQVHGNFYGSPKKPIEASLMQGKDILFDIDYQGAQQVRANAPDDVVSIFILPPSIEALRERLEHRAQDEAAVIERRMEAAAQEISHQGEYDYRIMNGQFDAALAELKNIVEARRAG